jgi:hypothetical protein
MARDSAKYWWGVLYPENMKENWEEEIADLVQLPFAYCKHTLDTDAKSEHRKDHIHLIIAHNNTTTYQSMFKLFDKLSAEGRKALNKIEAINNIRYAYDYLIHDTETCRKKGKYLYKPSDRILGNNFDIGAYEQISMQEEDEMKLELIKEIMKNNFTDMIDFTQYVMSNFETKYIKLVLHNGSTFERYTKANYLKWEKSNKTKNHS